MNEDNFCRAQFPVTLVIWSAVIAKQKINAGIRQDDAMSILIRIGFVWVARADSMIPPTNQSDFGLAKLTEWYISMNSSSPRNSG
jgi:hypothetical protein